MCPSAVASSFSASLLVAERARLQTQRVQPDEPLGVGLAIDAVGLEGGDVRAIEAQRRLSAADRHAPLEELETRRAAHRLLRTIDRRLQHLALRREPVAVVDETGAS